MILSSRDISTIVNHGFVRDDFCFKDQEGFFKLKNVNGQCFFLRNNKCTIYSIRPLGCKFYPIIFDVDFNKAILDDDCPLVTIITQNTIKQFENDLRKFIAQILQEQEVENES